MTRYDLALIGLLFLCLVAVVVSGLYWAGKSRYDTKPSKTKSTEYWPWK